MCTKRWRGETLGGQASELERPDCGFDMTLGCPLKLSRPHFLISEVGMASEPPYLRLGMLSTQSTVNMDKHTLSPQIEIGLVSPLPLHCSVGHGTQGLHLQAKSSTTDPYIPAQANFSKHLFSFAWLFSNPFRLHTWAV